MGEGPGIPKLGNLAHDTSGWLVTKGLQPVLLPWGLGSSCVVSASLLAGVEKKEGRTGATLGPNPEGRPGSNQPPPVDASGHFG